MAAGDKITNQRESAVFYIAAHLDMHDDTNTFLRSILQQPDGIYAEANISEMATFLKWHLGRDNQLAQWWPSEVYQALVNVIVDFPYNQAKVADLLLPPENAAGGVGECTCDSDAYGSRTPVNFKFNETTHIWTEQAAGVEDAGTWTFTEAAGVYAMVFLETENALPTKFVTVT